MASSKRNSKRNLFGKLIGLAPILIPMHLTPWFATEKQSLEHALENYPKVKRDTRNLIANIMRILKPESAHLRILEIGSGLGSFVMACGELGYSCEGIEPSDNALDTSRKIAAKLNVELSIEKAFAEELPFADGSFDIVVSLSVMEHVRNVEKAFSEAFRALKNRGAFYFSAASSLCPHQDEIRFFPFFSWYPDNVKLTIMHWALIHKPSWIEHAETPAINWFTPKKANRLLKEAGFGVVYDRWNLLVRQRAGPFQAPMSLNLIASRMAKIIESRTFTKLWADVLLPDCAYLAIKTMDEEEITVDHVSVSGDMCAPKQDARSIDVSHRS